MKTYTVKCLIGYIDGNTEEETSTISARSIKTALAMMELRRKELIRNAISITGVEFTEIKMIREQEA